MQIFATTGKVFALILGHKKGEKEIHSKRMEFIAVYDANATKQVEMMVESQLRACFCDLEILKLSS